MSRWSFTALSRPARIGALVGLAIVSPFGPFLEYAGYAVAIWLADWTGSVAGHTVGSVVRPVAFIPCLLLVFGGAALCGGLLGSAISRIKARSTRAQQLVAADSGAVFSFLPALRLAAELDIVRRHSRPVLGPSFSSGATR